MPAQALRRSKEARPFWIPELTGLVFHMWYRMIQYKKAYKGGKHLPKFGEPVIPQWATWVHAYTHRQLMKQRVVQRVSTAAPQPLSIRSLQARENRSRQRSGCDVLHARCNG